MNDQTFIALVIHFIHFVFTACTEILPLQANIKICDCDFFLI